jgi:hypothetical protein
MAKNLVEHGEHDTHRIFAHHSIQFRSSRAIAPVYRIDETNRCHSRRSLAFIGSDTTDYLDLIGKG